MVKSSSTSMWSSSLPLTRCATRLPASASGSTTWCTPMRDRIRECSGEIAFAQICGVPRSTRLPAIRTLASSDVPTPTTATGNSFTPSWTRASGLVQSASTRGKRPVKCATTSGSRSAASTSWPRCSSVRAIEEPNRPSPITSTPPLRSRSLPGLGSRPANGATGLGRSMSTNDRPLLGVPDHPAPVAQRKSRCQGHGSRPTCEHQDGQHVLARVGQLPGQPGAEPDGTERGDRLEEHLVQALAGDLEQQEGGHQHHARTGDSHRDGEPEALPRDAPAEGLHVAVAAGLGQDREQQHGEGCLLYTSP